MDEGYIKLNRCIKHNWLWALDEPFDMRSAWVDLLLLANWQDVKRFDNGKFVEYKSGVVHRSILELAARWRWDRKKVRRFLDVLEQDKMVIVNTSKHGTTITIVNWDLYQNHGSTNGTTTTTTSTTTTTPTTPHKEELKELETLETLKEYTTPLPPSKGRTPKKKKGEKNIELFDKMQLGFGFSDRMMDTLLSWMRYKGEDKGFEYKETGMMALLRQVAKYTSEYGSDAVIDCINLSMSSGYQGIIWDRLEKDSRGGYQQNTASFMDVIRDEIYGGG